MVAVILITVGMTAFFANRAANAEIERVQDRDDVTRNHRLADLLSRSYTQNQDWSGSQNILEHAAELTGERVVLTNQYGVVVADSHATLTGRRLGYNMPSQAVMPVLGPQGRLATLLVNPNLPAQSVDAGTLNEEPPQPSLSVLLILSGLLAVGVAMILTFFVSHRILTPIESLSKVSRLTAQRDFSARAEVRYRDEVGSWRVLSTPWSTSCPGPRNYGAIWWPI
ncbi:MAG TPA: hypothetical protein VFA32_02420 [Dehalococcoidia bacterium]|nr:hypothetical protein [Dehalococcoidia bacterium]